MTPLQIRLLENYALLHTKQYSFWVSVRLCLRSWLALLLCVGLGLWMITKLGMIEVGCVLIGMAIGAFLRDIGRYRVAIATWPVIEDITIWERVHSILRAHGVRE